jgi:DASS family divalent anion:Na+ symporter
MKSKYLKLLGIALIPFVINFIPAPGGLTPEAWTMLGIYLAAIVGIILQPFSEPVMMLSIIGIGGLFVEVKPLLGGFADTSVWLVFSAFLISQAFVNTGLGKRIAYLLIGKFGKTTLGLGYVMGVTDLIISPATPSNTARSGGIVYPVFKSISEALGSEPGESSKKLGSYLTILMYHVSLSTAALFLTAMAPNSIVAKYSADILNVDLSWLNWSKGLFVPGIIVLAFVPYIIYKIYPPEIKNIDNYKEISSEGLKEMGPMSSKEKLLVVFFILAVLAWSTGTITKLNGTAVAIAFLAACLLSGILDWASVLNLKGAWTTLIWYGGIVGLSSALSKLEFFTWLASAIQGVVSFDGVNSIIVYLVLVILSLVSRYIFASTAAYVASFIPVIFTIGVAAGVPVAPLAFLIAASSAYGALLTHYGGALGPVLFGTGYVTQKTWWKLGAVTVAFNIVVYFTIGLAFWKVIGIW